MRLALAILAVVVLAGWGVWMATDGDDSPASTPRAAPEPAATGTVADAPAESGCSPYPAKFHTKPAGKDGDVSGAFVDDKDCTVVLNGFNVFPLWPDPPRMAFDAEHYRSIRAKGFTAVRFLLPWAIYEPEPGKFAHMEELDRAVGYAREAGLYVVMLNIIVDGWNEPPGWAEGGDKIDKIHRNSKAWTQELARRYGNDATVAAFDLVAELPSNDQNRLLTIYSDMIEWIRDAGSDKVAIITAGWGNSSMAPQFADPARLKHKENVVHSFHDYYAGDGDSEKISGGYNEAGGQAGNHVWDGKRGYDNTGDAADFEAHMGVQLSFARRAGLPLWISEYGINPEAANATEWAKQKTALYEKHGLGRAFWYYNCGESFGIKDDACGWQPITDALL